jgi:membrane fusion protein, heavy metal efflux system
MKRISIFIFLSILLTACSSKTNKTKEERAVSEKIITLTAAQLKNAAIETISLQEKEFTGALLLNGKIDVPPQSMVSISVPLGGYLKSTQLLPGMRVKKGQAIAVVEDQQYIQLQQDYLTAKAKINYLEAEFNRQKELNESKASSDKNLQLAEADYKSQKVLIRSLAEKLELAGINIQKLSEETITRSVNIYSPINGYVSKVNVNIGKYVAPTEVLFELINPADIHLNINVFEKDIQKLRIGQVVVAWSNSNPSKKYACEIILIGQSLNTDNYAEVHCHFLDHEHNLVPGTFMNAQINTASRTSLCLPEDAIVRFEGKQYIFSKLADAKFEMLEVQTGDTENGFTEIRNPESFRKLSIVGKGAYTLLMGLKNKEEEE